MQQIQMKESRKLIGLKAESFPNGVVPAFDALEKKVGKGRKVYGMSRGDGKSNIDYWACVLENTNERPPMGCEELEVKAGTYVSERLSNWQGREEILGQTFQTLYSHPQVDPNGYCVEEYLDNGDVLCMVRIIPKK